MDACPYPSQLAAHGVLHPMLLHGHEAPVNILTNPVPPMGAGQLGVNNEHNVSPALLFSPVHETNLDEKGMTVILRYVKKPKLYLNNVTCAPRGWGTVIKA